MLYYGDRSGNPRIHASMYLGLCTWAHVPRLRYLRLTTSNLEIQTSRHLDSGNYAQVPGLDHKQSSNSTIWHWLRHPGLGT